MERVNSPPQYYYICNCPCHCETSIGPVRKRLSTYLVDIICGDCGEGTHSPGYDENEDDGAVDYVTKKFGGLIK